MNTIRLVPVLVAAAVLTLSGACTSDSDLSARAIGLPLRQVAVGSACVSDDDCGFRQACFGDPGECLCQPEFVLCGDRCLDLNWDRANCGGCGALCNVVGAPFDVRTSPYGQTAACESGGCGTGIGTGGVPKCNGGCDGDCAYAAGHGCARLVSKIHMTVKYDAASGRAYLYLVYDERCTNTDGDDGGLHLKSRLDVVDITNELNPSRRATALSSACSVQSNDFAGTVSALANTYSGGPNNVAYFFYRQPAVGNPPQPDACNTIYTGFRGPGLVPGNLTSYGTIAGPFPTIVFETAKGLGDYTAAVRRGVTGYVHFPTWAQPVQTNVANCLGCNVDGAGAVEQYNLAVFGTGAAQ